MEDISTPAVPINSCTMRGEIRTCGDASCNGCGFSAAEVERRREMIRAGKMRIDADAGARIIREWPTDRFGKMDALLARQLQMTSELKTLFVRDGKQEDNNDTI